MRSRLHKKPTKRAVFLAFSSMATIWLWIVISVVNSIMPVASAYAPESNLTQPYQEQETIQLPMHTQYNENARQIVLSMATLKWGEKEAEALDQLISHESGWDLNAINPTSGACGLFQNINCNYHSMNLEDQIQWGFNYIQERYSTPSNAWKFWQTKHLINGQLVNYY